MCIFLHIQCVLLYGFDSEFVFSLDSEEVKFFESRENKHSSRKESMDWKNLRRWRNKGWPRGWGEVPQNNSSSGNSINTHILLNINYKFNSSFSIFEEIWKHFNSEFNCRLFLFFKWFFAGCCCVAVRLLLFLLLRVAVWLLAWIQSRAERERDSTMGN